MNLLRRPPTSNSALCNIKSPQKTNTTVPPGIRPRVLKSNRTSPAVSVLASNGPNGGNGAAVDTITEEKDRGLFMLKRAISITEQQALRVAYQGIPGAYSEEAAMATHPGCRGMPCAMYETAIRAVERREADRAILPVESTLEGTIHPNYDLLLDHRHLHIVGEIHYPIQYCLLALPGVGREEIRRVMSHPLAISQCKQTLASLGLTNASKQTADDTAGAAECVARNGLSDTGAIASARAAEIYGLRVLARGIQDEPYNLVRFLILARDPLVPTVDRPHKTSIVFAHDGELGVLFRVLSAFSFRNINLTKLESRPRKNRPLRSSGSVKQFQYVFYIDFEASLADRRVQNALAELKEFSSFLRVFGSYPMDTNAKV